MLFIVRDNFRAQTKSIFQMQSCQYYSNLHTLQHLGTCVSPLYTFKSRVFPILLLFTLNTWIFIYINLLCISILSSCNLISLSNYIVHCISAPIMYPARWHRHLWISIDSDLDHFYQLYSWIFENPASFLSIYLCFTNVDIPSHHKVPLSLQVLHNLCTAAEFFPGRETALWILL